MTEEHHDHYWHGMFSEQQDNDPSTSVVYHYCDCGQIRMIDYWCSSTLLTPHQMQALRYKDVCNDCYQKYYFHRRLQRVYDLWEHISCAYCAAPARYHADWFDYIFTYPNLTRDPIPFPRTNADDAVKQWIYHDMIKVKMLTGLQPNMVWIASEEFAFLKGETEKLMMFAPKWLTLASMLEEGPSPISESILELHITPQRFIRPGHLLFLKNGQPLILAEKQ
jgi:hypothetical protein